MSIGARLREERNRLGFSQAAFADAVGRDDRTVQSWEADRTSPSALALARLAANGLDVGYVVTGRPIGVPIEDAAAQPERSIRALLPLIAPLLRKPLLLALLTEEMKG